MKPDRWPLPRMEEIFDTLGGWFVFTALDLFSGYGQVEMSEDCREVTPFVCRYRTLMFAVMPRVLMNSPFTFQRMVDDVLREHSCVRLYIDENVIFSSSLKEHVIQLKAVIGRILKHELKLKLSICFFALS